MPNRPSGSLEQEVLAILAAAGEALTPAAVQAQLSGARAYTTVMTTLSRLHAKGAVTRERAGLPGLRARDLGSSVVAGLFLAAHFAAWLPSLPMTTVAASTLPVLPARSVPWSVEALAST